jgi:hypothetical protein
MSLSPTTDTPPRPPLHLPSLLQLIFSALAAILLIGVAGIFTITGISELVSGKTINSGSSQPFMVAGSLAFAGILVIPSAWYAWRNIAHPGFEPVSRPESSYFGLILTIVVLVVVSGTLFLGNWVSQNNSISWFVLPFLNIIATGLPALWVIYFGTRGLLPNKPRYKWGVFASGLVLGPSIILILELILIIVVGIFSIAWIMLNPSLSNQLNGLAFRLQNGVPDTQTIINALLPFLLNPVILFLGLASVSVLVPIIEETFKPLGVWFMAGQKITPAQGFGFGVLSGAAFGLFENLGNTSSGGTDWALLAGSRVSTLLLHSFTAGLVGWALASAWTQRRFLRLAASFTIAILIHGTWNGLAVLSAASSLQGVTSLPLPAALQQIGTIATVGIFALGLLVLVLFFSFNSALRHSLPTPLAPTSSPEPVAYNPVGPDQSPTSVEPSTSPSDASDVPSAPDEYLASSETNLQHLSPGEESMHSTESSE